MFADVPFGVSQMILGDAAVYGELGMVLKADVPLHLPATAARPLCSYTESAMSRYSSAGSSPSVAMALLVLAVTGDSDSMSDMETGLVGTPAGGGLEGGRALRLEESRALCPS